MPGIETPPALMVQRQAPCCLGGDAVVCICSETERVLRAFASGTLRGPALTPEERAWCMSEIDCVEGHDANALEGCSDRELAQAVLDAWNDYCRDKGLL